jgi:hypothetical protein
MRYLSLPAALLLTLCVTGPAPAQTPQWEANATPVMPDNGRPYCRMTTYSSEDSGIGFVAFPGRDIIVVSSPSLEGFGTPIRVTLRLGNFKDYPLTMLGSGGGYSAILTSDGMKTVLNVLILYGDEETRLTVGSETELIIPSDGAQDAARTMWDCRAELPDG